jgi:hypothetical protein
VSVGDRPSRALQHRRGSPEAGEGLEGIDLRSSGWCETVVREHGLVDGRLGVLHHGSGRVPFVAVLVMGLVGGVLDHALEESLEDIAIVRVFIEKSHVHGVERVVLLKQHVGDLLDRLIILGSDAGELEPLKVQLAARHHQGNQSNVEG